MPDDLVTSIRIVRQNLEWLRGPNIRRYNRHILSIVGAPLLADSQRPRFFELVLFAATWIAGCNDAPTPSDFAYARSTEPLSPIRTAEVQIKLDRGWNWLKVHLPAMCFAPKVEKAIEATADLKYELGAAPPAGTAT